MPMDVGELTEDALRTRGLDMPVSARRSHAKPRKRLRTILPGDSTRCRLTLVHLYAAKLVHNPWFDYCMGVIIVANCATIGLEIQRGVDSDAPTPPEFQALEHCFLAAYVVELSIRMLGNWEECKQSAWFRMDFILVILGVLSIWVLESLMGLADAVELLDKVLVIRIVRLLRLVRTLRFLKFMHPLWKLVSGLLGSNSTVTSAGVLLFGAVYVFACAGVALLGEDEALLSDPVAGPIVADHFRSIPVLMLTMMQFTSCDGVAAIYHPLIRAKPGLILYFLPILLAVPISLMNLILRGLSHQPLMRGSAGHCRDRGPCHQGLHARRRTGARLHEKQTEGVDTRSEEDVRGFRCVSHWGDLPRRLRQGKDHVAAPRDNEGAQVSQARGVFPSPRCGCVWVHKPEGVG